MTTILHIKSSSNLQGSVTRQIGPVVKQWDSSGIAGGLAFGIINGNIPQAEMRTYSNSQTAASNADAAIKQGVDPTHGAIYFYMAGDNQSIKYGKLTLSTGPFYNSFPNRAVPYKQVYINFSK